VLKFKRKFRHPKVKAIHTVATAVKAIHTVATAVKAIRTVATAVKAVHTVATAVKAIYNYCRFSGSDSDLILTFLFHYLSNFNL
jgi:hypothetical protein